LIVHLHSHKKKYLDIIILTTAHDKERKLTMFRCIRISTFPSLLARRSLFRFRLSKFENTSCIDLLSGAQSFNN